MLLPGVSLREQTHCQSARLAHICTASAPYSTEDQILRLANYLVDISGLRVNCTAFIYSMREKAEVWAKLAC